ncbi:hypothetical protein JMN32_18395 [Fulvivirga sp. 29W222]|uniref:Uncharacterized protein n=1 Tax=Fulvivirga marina TaxID=2494733 RepID=A0A937KCM3_9BACT|nr:hypothetical protein [Fulvivirga marina]MBL6448291.1 hypothetical protein [Fulvivirga marina]
MMNIKDPSISKEKYDYRLDLRQRVSYEKWVNFIENHKKYFIWQEETDEGRETLAKLDKIPESFREGIVKGHNKSRAFAEFNPKRSYYEMYVDFNEKYGMVTTTFMKPITKDHLRILLDMANYLDAYLLNNGTEIIDEKVLGSLK